jgi:hypothetical protein
MTDRPIAAVLALVAAIVFVAAFSAAAVMRPNQAAVAESASARTAPETATEETRVATLVAPSLSRVVALPALHLPKAPKPAKKKKAAKKRVAAPPRRTTPVAPPPAATAVPTPAPRVVTPPRTGGGGSNVGKTFDSEG